MIRCDRGLAVPCGACGLPSPGGRLAVQRREAGLHLGSGGWEGDVPAVAFSFLATCLLIDRSVYSKISDGRDQVTDFFPRVKWEDDC